MLKFAVMQDSKGMSKALRNHERGKHHNGCGNNLILHCCNQGGNPLAIAKSDAAFCFASAAYNP
jgi:hypothetical protein